MIDQTPSPSSWWSGGMPCVHSRGSVLEMLIDQLARSPIPSAQTGAAGIKCDLTVSRLSEESFYSSRGPDTRTRDKDWITRNLDPALDARLIDVTSAQCRAFCHGPQTFRALLQTVSGADLSNEGPSFCQLARDIHRGRARVARPQGHYVGELGWSCTCRRAPGGPPCSIG